MKSYCTNYFRNKYKLNVHLATVEIIIVFCQTEADRQLAERQTTAILTQNNMSETTHKSLKRELI